MKRPRKIRLPSSSHLLVALAIRERADRPHHWKRNLKEHFLEQIQIWAGFAGADWAIKQLVNLPETVRPGWPNPCTKRRKRGPRW